MGESSFTHLVSLLFMASVVAAQTLTNVTIDDTSAMITYTGVWDARNAHPSVLDFGGSHRLSTDRTSSAVFTFTGVAVYYIAPQLAYAVNSYLAIDGGAPELVDLMGHLQDGTNGAETVLWSVLWSKTGLTNGEHRVVVTRGPAGYNVVDGFTYAKQDGGLASSPPYNSTTTIAIAVSVSVVGLIRLGLIVFFVRRNKKIKAAKPQNMMYGSGAGGMEVGGASSHPNAYSAMDSAQDATYITPYPTDSGPHGSGMALGETSMHDPRYPARTQANTVLYTHDPYRVYPVSNATFINPYIVAPSAGPGYSAAGVDFRAAEHNSNNGGGPSGYKAAPTRAFRPLGSNADLPAGAAAPQLPMLKARYEGQHNQRPHNTDSLQIQGPAGAGGSSTMTPPVHVGTGATAPPPYADQ